MLFQSHGHRTGLDEELIVKCKNCNMTTCFHTSQTVDGGAGKSSEVNARGVEAGIATGFGCTNMQSLCSIFYLHLPLSYSAYTAPMKQLDICYRAERGLSLQNAAFR